MAAPADKTGSDSAPLARYNTKRDFAATSEPAGVATKRARRRAAAEPLRFVVQKHWASRLHYDFRLELGGVLLSWAVPKGPCYDPSKMQMAIHVEDHPLDYAAFEGTIPAKQYGAGTVIVWDRGTWEPVGDAGEGMRAGKLLFKLHGEKLAGLWELVRIAKPGDRQDPWMLFKKRDAWARPLAEYDVIAALPDSVVAKPLGLIEQREPRGAESAAVAALPERLEPQLATLVTAAPAGEWIVETKFDGYRVMARVEGGRVKLITRGGHDWTAKMKSLAAAIEQMDLGPAWLDGEIVVLSEAGLPDFNALQNAMDTSSSGAIVYFVFDLPFHGGRDLRQVPLRARRALLAELVEATGSDRVRLSQSFAAAPAQMLEAACRMQLEGIILKRPDAPYVSQRTETWLKLKCSLRQEFVICGFTDRGKGGAPTLLAVAAPRGGAAGLGAARRPAGEVGSLLLATYERGELVYAGNVGTGWNAKAGRALHARLVQIESKQPTLAVASIQPGRWSRRTAGAERWVRPELVAEVSFREWTPDGHIRHAVFVALRADKPARMVSRDTAQVPAAGKSGDGGMPSVPARPAAALKVTHPERVIDAATGLTKLALVRYYESIAERMLPHLQGRPVSLVRAPDGIAGELFFQKHPETRLPGLRAFDKALWPGHAALLAVDSAEALLAAAQLNTIEFHTWNSTAAHIERPDRVIFDLDPGEGVSWKQVQEAALLTRALLTELELTSWLKTSGGKGLHVVVPLAPERDSEVVKRLSQRVVVHLAKTIPERFVAKAGGANRVGRVFVDWLRNGHTATTAAAFSARARPGLGVSMPVAWEQLMALKGGAQWSIATAREYLSFETVDPWADYWLRPQRLDAALEALGLPRGDQLGA